MDRETFKIWAKKAASLIAVVAIIGAVIGSIHYLNPCWWPFGNNGQAYASHLLDEYRSIENDWDYDKTLYKKIKRLVICDRKSNITLHLVYLRLKYFDNLRHSIFFSGPGNCCQFDCR